jgi:hypothetical protein
MVERNGTATRSSIHEATLSGGDREIRPLDGKGSVQFVTSDLLLSAAAGTIEPVGGGSPRQIHPAGPIAFAAVSPDSRWIAFTPNGVGSASAPAQYDVVSLDGTSSRTVRLQPGYASTLALFSTDSRALFVPNANSGSNGRTPETPAQILQVSIPGGEPRVAVTLPAHERFSGGALSPDGKTLVYVGEGPEQQQMVSLDLSEITKATRPKN